MKKERLEEVAERYANDWEEIHPELDPENMTPIAVSKIDFTEGAKYQQEQDKNRYSEKEVLELLLNCSTNTEKETIEWFEQFKKK